MDVDYMDFSGRKALVTGASRGIGAAVARQLAARGARVAVHYNRGQDAAEAVRASLSGGPHITIGADMADASAVQAMVDRAAEALGGLDILINNAGIFEEHPPTAVDYAAWQDHWARTIGVNLIGAANAAYCAAKHMMASGGGHIVNVSSRGAFRGEPDAPAYGASKAGMNSMSQSLAKALAPHGITVTVVAPGWVATDMAPDADSEARKAVNQQSPLGRIATPEEVANAVVFLASRGATMMTGTIVDVNGASYLRM
jgi:NAD(P)-dependent dehydrogenase (short-subunit alcohol dehydrogenase family)